MQWKQNRDVRNGERASNTHAELAFGRDEVPLPTLPSAYRAGGEEYARPFAQILSWDEDFQVGSTAIWCLVSVVLVTHLSLVFFRSISS